SLILILGLSTYLFNFLPGMENLFTFGADNILQAFERVMGIRVSKTSIVAKRCLSVKVPDGDVTQQGLELPPAQGFDEGLRIRTAGPLDGLGYHVRGDIAEHIARLGLVASPLLELGHEGFVVLLLPCNW